MDVDLDRLYDGELSIRQELILADCQARCEKFLLEQGVEIGYKGRFLINVLAHQKARPRLTDPRRRIVRMLWASDMWREPWTSLVDRELPGADPAEVVGMQTDRADRMTSEMLEILRQAGYTLEAATLPTVYELSLTALLRELDMPTYGLTLRNEAADVIRRGGHPHHSGWRQILDRYFPPK